MVRIEYWVNLEIYIKKDNSHKIHNKNRVLAAPLFRDLRICEDLKAVIWNSRRAMAQISSVNMENYI